MDTGATWTLVYYSTPGAYLSFYLSPNYATDSTVYLTTGTNKLIKSCDGGATWTSENIVGGLAAGTYVNIAAAPLIRGINVGAFAAIDGTNYIVATSAGVRYSNSANTVYLGGCGSKCYLEFWRMRGSLGSHK